MNITDVHIHMHTLDLNIGKSCLEYLASLGVKKAVIHSLANYKEGGELETVYGLMLKNIVKNPEVYTFGSLYETGILAEVSYEKQLEKLLAMGCDGIKFLNMKPDMRKRIGKGLNHPSYDGVLSVMEEKEIPVLIHSKDPVNFWHAEQMPQGQIEAGWCYEGKGFESYENLHGETLEMLDKHPKLKVILAHFFFESDNITEAERVMEKYPNVYFDIAPGTEMYENFALNIDKWREFFIKYQNRILFGTDSDDKGFGEFSDDIYRMILGVLVGKNEEYKEHCYIDLKLRGLNLPHEVAEKILWKNFGNYIGRKPKAVNSEKLKEEIEYLKKVHISGFINMMT